MLDIPFSVLTDYIMPMYPLRSERGTVKEYRHRKKRYSVRRDDNLRLGIYRGMTLLPVTTPALPRADYQAKRSTTIVDMPVL